MSNGPLLMQIGYSINNISKILNSFFQLQIIDFVQHVEKCSSIHVLE